MRFVDEEILIKITNRDTDQTRFFKSYLEKNDITVQVVELVNPLTTFLYDNTKLLSRPNYKLDLVFNVFSENRDEAIENFEKMHFLLDMVKPTVYYEVNDISKIDPKPYDKVAKVNSYIAARHKSFEDAKNAFAAAGLDIADEQSNSKIRLQLKYFPRISNSKKSDIYNVFPIAISCTPNLEMGYVQVPYWTNKRDELHVTNQMNMIPISYKVNFSANIVLSYAEATKQVENRDYELLAAVPEDVKTPGGPPPAATTPPPAATTPVIPLLSDLSLPSNQTTYNAFEKFVKDLGISFSGFNSILKPDKTPDTDKIKSIIKTVNEFGSRSSSIKITKSSTEISKIEIDSAFLAKTPAEIKVFNEFKKDLQKLIKP